MAARSRFVAICGVYTGGDRHTAGGAYGGLYIDGFVPLPFSAEDCEGCPDRKLMNGGSIGEVRVDAYVSDPPDGLGVVSIRSACMCKISSHV